MNLTAYAAHRKANGLRGASHVAVLKAIQTGRLISPAVERKGRGWDINPEIADQQWADATHPADRGTGHHRGKGPAVQRQEIEVPQGVPPRAVSESVLAAVKAKRETIALRKDEGMLLPTDQVEKVWANAVTIARTKLLAIPTRARQRIPHMSLEEVAIVEELIRETLEDLSSGE